MTTKSNDAPKELIAVNDHKVRIPMLKLNTANLNEAIDIRP